eukprot:GFUD01035375.1.p1 GENE.GFUD01035375.1~~GFUD01035375.1.p1  ORF type:complete len:344 (-),score=65.29 GFUD01035375.1:886-1917(-)
MSLKVAPKPNNEKLTSHSGDNNFRDRDKAREKDLGQGEIVLDRIYVGGLDHHIVDRDLFYFFSEFGAVRHVGIIMERGYSKGYGFVTFTCKEVVRRLLEGGEGDDLVLKGRRLRIGAARQRHFRGQGWRRPEDSFSQGRGPTGEDATISFQENTAVGVASGHSTLLFDNSQTASDEYPPGDSNSYFYDSSAQSPYYSQSNSTSIYPYQVPSYPLYYPQFQGMEYPQYPAYSPMSIPTSDMTWYPATYQDVTSVPLDATSPTFTDSNPFYPVVFSSPEVTHPMVAQPDQITSSAGPYWPQSPVYPQYPVIYSSGQHTMVQYSYPGQTCPPVSAWLPGPSIWIAR